MTSSENTVMDEATYWLSLHEGGGLSAQQRKTFLRWLNADAAHHQAFHLAQTLWQSNTVTVTAKQLEEQLQQDVPVQKKKRYRPAFATAACVLMLMVWQGSSLYFPAYAADQTTAVGEQKYLDLADGSEIILNTATAFSSSIDDAQRTAQVHQGEAFFKIAKDERRPFQITAGEANITVLGTEFSVRYEHDATWVRVLKGKVAVQGGHERTELIALDVAKVSPNGQVEVVRRGAAAQDFSWTQQRLIFSETSFLGILQELERYQEGRIVVLDKALEQELVVGNYSLENPAQVIDSLVEIQQAKVMRLGKYFTFIF